GVEHADEREVGEVMALRQDLRADQDVAFASADLRQRARQLATAASSIAVDPHDARARKAGRERLLDALRTPAHGLEIDVATRRAAARNRLLGAAVMAVQASIRGVEHEPSSAALAARVPAARLARQDRRIAAPVDENQALLAPSEALRNRFEHRRAEALLDRRSAHVHRTDPRQPRTRRRALRKLDAL